MVLLSSFLSRSLVGAEQVIIWDLNIETLLSDQEGANHHKQKDDRKERSKSCVSIKCSRRVTATCPQLLSSVHRFI